ncbi:MAG: ABC transporter ATP-binding protein [Elusimicrobiota bacterium]|jgi:ABC-2 type transport system ATP-binding protein
MPSTVAVELCHVTKVYRRRHLGRLTLTPGVEDISLQIQSGELFGLLGLNGAGKTTTIKLLLGLLFPTTGDARLFDHLLPDRAIMRQIGYLPELPSFYKYLTVNELLQLYGTLNDLPETLLTKRIEQVLAEVGLAAHQTKRLGEYSKGLLQRAGLAQALLHDPALLVLDEPMSGLDPLGLKEMRQMLERLHAQGKTIFFSSHNISEAEKLCDRVGIIHQGRLARLIEKAEWKGPEGRLEQLFIETIHA